MSRHECLQPSSFDVHALYSEECKKGLSTLLSLLSSCAGPYGKNHVIRNTCGGHLTITSTCRRLLSAIMISRSELKLITSSVLGHLKEFGDGGLFMACMILRFVIACISLNRPPVPHFTISSLLHAFVSTINSYFSSDKCEVVVKVDFTDLKILLAYVKSVLTSKTLINFHLKDTNTLSCLLVETFLGSVPSVHGKRFSNGIFVIGIENQPMRSSKALEGLLLACPEISRFKDSFLLHLKTNSENDESGKSFSYIKVVVFTCSMSGDLEEVIQATYEAEDEQFSDIDARILQEMLVFCEYLDSENIGVVFCQKVIHPRIKAALKSKGILFMERLGSQIIPYLRDITGCVPMSSILLNVGQINECVGRISSLEYYVEGKHRFLRLNNKVSSVMSFIVCNEFEESLSELKNSVNACFQGLSTLAKEPKFLMGGGCWQMNCVAILEKEFLDHMSVKVKELSCSENELRQILSMYISSLKGWCLQLKNEQEYIYLDPHCHHIWRLPKGLLMDDIDPQKMLPCCCGFKSVASCQLSKLNIILNGNASYHSAILRETQEAQECHVQDNIGNEDIVLDSFSSALQALNKAALAASMLLSVGQFAMDRN